MIEVFTDKGRPIKSWAIDLEDGARKQMINVSRLPFVVSHVALERRPLPDRRRRTVPARRTKRWT